MLQLRKKRVPLHQKRHKDDPLPTLLVSLEEKTPADTIYEISILNVNTTGMGIISSVPLTVGQSLFIADKQQDWTLPKHGVVMWTFQNQDGFRAGIKFA